MRIRAHTGNYAYTVIHIHIRIREKYAAGTVIADSLRNSTIGIASS